MARSRASTWPWKTVSSTPTFTITILVLTDPSQVVEKSQKNATKIPAVAKVPAVDGKRLHAFTTLPSSIATILAPRRLPAVKASVGNGDDFVQIFTSNGFQPLTNADYLASIETLRPDIAIPLADMHYAAAARVLHAKGLVRMCERTEDWMSQLHARLDRDRLRAAGTAIFAPTLPAPYPMQWAYLERLADDLRGAVDGLAIYDVDLLSDLTAGYPSLRDLPRLSLDAPADPHAVLRQVALGIDVFLLPFVNVASDAGIALTFTFPPPVPGPPTSSPPPAPTTLSTTETTAPAPDGLGLLPLGIDLAAPGHATALEPLAPGCACHACAAHHRAYLHHLLDAREMLAWVLLQIHNHHTVTLFLAGVRAALAAGTFDAARRRFHTAYEPDLPLGCGTRPRARGYHFKSEGGDAPRNKVTWQALQEERGPVGVGIEAARTGSRSSGGEKAAAVVLEERLASGTTESPVPPGENVGAEELVRGGMGEVVTKDEEKR